MIITRMVRQRHLDRTNENPPIQEYQQLHVVGAIANIRNTHQERTNDISFLTLVAVFLIKKLFLNYDICKHPLTKGWRASLSNRILDASKTN